MIIPEIKSKQSNPVTVKFLSPAKFKDDNKNQQSDLNRENETKPRNEKTSFVKLRPLALKSLKTEAQPGVSKRNTSVELAIFGQERAVKLGSHCFGGLAMDHLA
ncbi:unnamed protein product [Dovyalis caffra]|uniref:Uncharacterized protein n=1 Tax=Dovyalis caffra TaxID=77055 RepID=A0AAV1RNY7_9ROSI|nr:unnamed protein product [Dovyalis caffra]